MSTVKELISELVARDIELPEDIDAKSLFVDAMKNGHHDLGFKIASTYDVDIESILATREYTHGLSYLRWLSIFFREISGLCTSMSLDPTNVVLGDICKKSTEHMFTEGAARITELLSRSIRGLSKEDVAEILAETTLSHEDLESILSK